VGLQDVRYAAIEPLHHAIGSRSLGPRQPVFYAQFLAQLVELMVATGLALPAGKQAIGELLAVVGQQPGVLIGQALCSAFRNACALAAVLLALSCTKTHRVARSMATNKYRLLLSSCIWGRYFTSMCT